ncbi:uncharacterized protein B0T15DRAFT_19906 [Chaetomium strumarium]|uniref:Uncharacterized protein n=1 Tax=Chaetomium strumarium TaxID=1170767 RepID=A0AAJ0H1G3_9PEZI|nr:hypothetical protein B0T15DRAFT_19906 [Chaetomium strumarium]
MGLKNKVVKVLEFVEVGLCGFVVKVGNRNWFSSAREILINPRCGLQLPTACPPCSLLLEVVVLEIRKLGCRPPSPVPFGSCYGAGPTPGTRTGFGPVELRPSLGSCLMSHQLQSCKRNDFACGLGRANKDVQRFSSPFKGGVLIRGMFLAERLHRYMISGCSAKYGRTSPAPPRPFVRRGYQNGQVPLGFSKGARRPDGVGLPAPSSLLLTGISLIQLAGRYPGTLGPFRLRWSDDTGPLASSMCQAV